MKGKNKIILGIFLAVDAAFLILAFWLIGGMDLRFPVLSPKGAVAYEQKKLLVTAVLVMLSVVVPLFAAIVYTVRAYRVREFSALQTGTDQPQSHKGFQLLWWIIPASAILVISVMNWNSSHALDPYKPLDSKKNPLTVQVVALQWKWLFIYPEQNIATVNFLEFPAETPVRFLLTADAPFSSMWIPELGGQMMAMQGMETRLHLMASRPGKFGGSNAEISGEGFAGMRFTAKAVSEEEFAAWVKSIQFSGAALTPEEYDRLAKASANVPEMSFRSVEKGLFGLVMQKYAAPR